jgi:hypothetical protein
MRALQRVPGRRFQTAEEMQEALEAYIAESGPPLMQSAVGQLCRTVFNDRIAQKHELLRACEDISGGMLPEAEMPSNPTLTMGGATVSHVRILEEERAHRRRLMLLGLTALILGAAVAVFVGLVVVKPPPQELTGAVRGGVSGTADKAPARKVTVSISVTPFNATLTLGGKAVGNPYEVQREAGEGTVIAEARADGFVTRQFKIPLAEGGRWMLALERKAEPIVVPDTKVKTRVKTKAVTKRRRTKTDDDEIFDPYGK